MFNFFSSLFSLFETPRHYVHFDINKVGEDSDILRGKVGPYTKHQAKYMRDEMNIIYGPYSHWIEPE